jgi:hypothetical protein
MSIVNRTYMFRGVPVVVLAKWRYVPTAKGAKGVPRYVLIEFPNGTKVVRPFRGLRKVAPKP